MKTKTEIKIWVGVLLTYGLLTITAFLHPEDMRLIVKILPIAGFIYTGANLGFTIRRHKKTKEVKGGMKR